MEPLLDIQHLHKTIGSFQLSDISLSLEPGYIMGLIGRNGAGKTTLINTILNLYKKDSGDVTVCGYPMETQEAAAKDQIGFVLDSFLFEEDFSADANGKLFGAFYSGYDHARFLELCRRFEINPKLKTKFLSRGQQIRFQLAFALSHHAKLFLMDEPAAGLDPPTRRELLGYMQDIIEDGTRSVLFSTHLTRDLDQIGDHIVLMNQGRILMKFDIETMKEDFRIFYGTKEEVEAFPASHPGVLCRLFEPFSCSMLVTRPFPEAALSMQGKAPTLEELMYYLQKGGHIQ